MFPFSVDFELDTRAWSDTVLVSGKDTILASTKTLTTHDNPADGAMEGAERVMRQTDYQLQDLTGFIHGTTLATNALIERRGAVVVTVTTAASTSFSSSARGK